jgi:hypothetical protein
MASCKWGLGRIVYHTCMHLISSYFLLSPMVTSFVQLSLSSPHHNPVALNLNPNPVMDIFC